MQIYNYYIEQIESGALSEGDKIPTEENIGSLFNVSRITVRQALNELAQNGYIHKIHGKGSFVSAKRADMQLNRLIGFSEEMKAQGMRASTQLMDRQIISPSALVQQSLELEPNQKVYFFTRLRCADDVAMAVEKVYLPFHRFVGIDKEDLTKSLYSLLHTKYECESSKAKQSIQAGISGAKEARLLNIKIGSPVLMIQRTTYEANGFPFEYVESVYRGDKYVFNVTLNQ